MRNLRNEIKPIKGRSLEDELNTLCSTIEIALTNDDEKIRAQAIWYLQDAYGNRFKDNGKLAGIFSEDHKIFVAVRRGRFSETVYVKDLPEKHHNKSHLYPFESSTSLAEEIEIQQKPLDIRSSAIQGLRAKGWGLFFLDKRIGCRPDLLAERGAVDAVELNAPYLLMPYAEPNQAFEEFKNAILTNQAPLFKGTRLNFVLEAITFTDNAAYFKPSGYSKPLRVPYHDLEQAIGFVRPYDSKVRSPNGNPWNPTFN